MKKKSFKKLTFFKKVKLFSSKRISIPIYFILVLVIFIILITFLLFSGLSTTDKSNKTFYSGKNIIFTGIKDKKINKNFFTNAWGINNIYFFDNNNLKVFFPKNSYKPSVKPIGGAGFIYKLDNSLSYAKLEYNIKFDDGFDFVKGGKLPGFCGGDCPRGGANTEKGFSTRFMWRSEGAIDLYAYIPGKNTPMGKSYGKGLFNFKPGIVYTISQELKLNTPGKNDGLLIIIVNGNEIYRNTEMIFRKSFNIGIDSILFSTFFGGGDPSWATLKDVNIEFGNFKIYY